jgi:hypothetical protein
MPPKAITSPYINFTLGGTAASSLSRGSSSSYCPYYSNNSKGYSYSYNYPLAAPILSANIGLITFLYRYIFPSYRLIPSY